MNVGNLFKIAASVASGAATGGTVPLAIGAISAVSKVLLNKENGTKEEIETALENATPEQAIEVDRIEKRFLGIKETIELLEALIKLTTCMAISLKEGDISNGIAMLLQKLSNDSEFQATMAKAASGIEQVPAEIMDLDFEESLTLGCIGLDFIKVLLTTLRDK